MIREDTTSSCRNRFTIISDLQYAIQHYLSQAPGAPCARRKENKKGEKKSVKEKRGERDEKGREERRRGEGPRGFKLLQQYIHNNITNLQK